MKNTKNNKSLSAVMEKYINDFDILNDSLSQMDYLLNEGLMKERDIDIESDQNRIEGCKTAIWLRVIKTHDVINFHAASDSMLVNGVLSVFENIYNGKTQSEIRGCKPVFLEHISDDVIYRDIKDNGLKKCYEKISMADEVSV